MSNEYRLGDESSSWGWSVHYPTWGMKLVQRMALKAVGGSDLKDMNDRINKITRAKG